MFVFWNCTKVLVEGFIPRKNPENVFFSGNKTLYKHSGAIKNIFLLMLHQFSCFFFSIFDFWAQKTLKKHILTSVWSVQHQNAGRNIQQQSCKAHRQSGIVSLSKKSYPHIRDVKNITHKSCPKHFLSKLMRPILLYRTCATLLFVTN